MTDAFEQFRREFFPDTEPHTLTIDILSEDWQALQALFAENDWTEDDGLRYTLAAGRAYIEGHVHLLSMPLSHPDPSTDRQTLADEVKRLRLERMRVESRYAVMKYRAYNFMQAAKVMEMKLNACHSELAGLRQANEQLRQKLPPT